MTGKKSKLCPMLQPFGRIGYVTIRKKIKATWKEKSTKHIIVGYTNIHYFDTYRMFNLTTRKINKTRDVGTWGEWKRVNPKSDMSVFVKDPALLFEPMGLDVQEVVTEPFEPPEPDRHLIPADASDSEAGRKKQGEQPTADTSKQTDVRADPATTAQLSSEAKARKLDRELKKLDSCAPHLRAW
jgi:hypothetical protein